MSVIRAGAWEPESTRGREVWGILCRTALRGVDLAAHVFGLEATENRLERAELFASYGLEPHPPGSAARAADVEKAVDWAKLSEFERGRVARAMKGAFRQ